MDTNKYYSVYIMKKLTNLKKRETKQKLLKEGGFTNIEEARKALGMTGKKAHQVYEQLMENHNKQIDTLRKLKLSQTNKESYDIRKDLKKVKSFNENGETVKIGNLFPKKLKKIIENIDTTKRTVLNINNRFYTLTPENQSKLLKEDFFVQEISSDYKGSDEEILYQITNVEEIELQRPKWMGKNKLEGAFFKYYHNTTFALSEFGIHETKQEEYNENCFVQALIALDVDDSIVKEVRKIICSKYLPTNKLSQIAEKFKLYIRVKTINTNHKDTLNYGKKGDKEVLLGLIDQHYFAVKKVNWTSYAVQNYFQLQPLYKDKLYHLYKNGSKISEDHHGTRQTNSWETIKYMFEHKEEYLTKIPYEHLLDTQYFKEAGDITNLDVSNNNFRENKGKGKSEEAFKVVFFDFETTTNELIHKPYMVCNSETEIEYGEDCGLKMLRKLYMKFHQSHKSITLIAHNAGYDFRFIQRYLQIDNIIERGHNVLEVKGRFSCFKGKSINIILKDSYSIITMPLSKFGKCFGLDQAKEILPYSLYTAENIKKRYLTLTECRPYCDQQVRCNNLDKLVTEDDYKSFFNKFVDNALNWGCLNGGIIDILKYSEVYCQRDVEVLKLGYTKFGSMLQESCNIRIEDFMSSAQLAHQYMLNQNVFDDVMQLSGTPRDYIMKCMVGGRTMCAENKKHHIVDIIDDFDAVSLYPSAMSRLGGYLKGKPKVLENRSYGFLKNQDGYFVQIKVTKVNKKYKFPLMSYKNDEGVRIWSNNPPDNLFVCKFELEDLITFHDIEFEIIDGYYYNEGRNNQLKEVIEMVFNERLKMKKVKNPLQEIYKLIMNSSYGKTLQKAISDEIKFKNDKEIDNFIDKYYNRIVHYEELYGNNDDYKRYKIKVEKGINEHFNNCHCGVEVLAMSKRIMNEVMCLAEDNKIDIYYQDTDSMHIKHNKIELLATKYEEKYERELIGKGMGQFHTDFDSDHLKGDIHAVECIFLGKKCYIDKLVGDEEGVYDYHIRMKGVPNGSIKYKAKAEDRTLMEIYKSLYDGHSETFDLCCQGDKISFEYNKDYTISTRAKFERTLKFTKDKGSIPNKGEELWQIPNPNPNPGVIYLLHSDLSNKTYVGKSVNGVNRQQAHMRDCLKDKNQNVHKHIMETGGFDNWKMTILENVTTKEAMQEREQYYIDRFKPSLNMRNAKRAPPKKEVFL